MKHIIHNSEPSEDVIEWRLIDANGPTLQARKNGGEWLYVAHPGYSNKAGFFVLGGALKSLGLTLST